MSGVLQTFEKTTLHQLPPNAIGEALETGHIVHFPECPFALPDLEQLALLREELPNQLTLKNISYHPEVDRVRGLDKNSPLGDLVYEILTSHSRAVSDFLLRVMPALYRNATVGTSSFRPIQEKGRDLKPHASNELVHVDAGAYGATNGNRILRFFVNVNPHEDRVWASRGSFPDLLETWGKKAGIWGSGKNLRLEKNGLDHTRTALLKGLSYAGLPLARVLDSSPYDRAMRRFHNFMKDSPEFINARDGYEELRFKPFAAWMVLTDMVSHASVSGQHALIHTSIVPRENCQHQELTPLNLLRRAVETHH